MNIIIFFYRFLNFVEIAKEKKNTENTHRFKV